MTPKRLAVLIVVELVATYILVGVFHATHNTAVLVAAVVLVTVIGLQLVFDVANDIASEFRARHD